MRCSSDDILALEFGVTVLVSGSGCGGWELCVVCLLGLLVFGNAFGCELYEDAIY